MDALYDRTAINTSRFTPVERAATLFSLLRAKAMGDGTGGRISFYDRSSRGFRSESQHHFLTRAAGVAVRMSQEGAGPGTPVIVACSKPEAVLLSFCGAVMLGAVPAIIAVRPAFDSRDVVAARVSNALRTVGEDAIVVAEGLDIAPEGRTVLLIDAAAACPSEVAQLPPVAAPVPESVSHIQLTSGSTGDGKGIAVTHSSLLANCAAFAERRAVGAEDVFLSWLPLYHDMGLVGKALLALTLGADLHLMSPRDFLSDPAGWVQALSDLHVTFFLSPTIGYELATERVSDAQLEGLDLSALRYAGCGAEPVRASVARAFTACFSGCGLRPSAFGPSYGLAEATLAVTVPGENDVWRSIRVTHSSLARMGKVDIVATTPDSAPPAVGEVDVISLGRPVSGLAIHLKTPDGDMVEEELVCGEVIVTGSSVTAGHVTERGRVSGFHDDGLHTGDIGFMQDEELFVVERIKNVIIRSGENYSAQVLEETLASVVGASADRVWVLDADLANGSTLTGLVEMNKRADLIAPYEAARFAASRFVPPLDELVFVRRGSLPRTTSGKKRHGAVRELLRTGELQSMARHELKAAAPTAVDNTAALPGDERAAEDQRLLVALVTDLVRNRHSNVPVSLHSRFRYDLDFDSLEMLELAIAVEETLDIELPQAEVSQVQTLSDLLNLVGRSRTGLSDLPGVSRTIAEFEAAVPQLYKTVSEQRGRDVLIDDRWVADFASCNYLALDLHDEVIASIAPAVERWGVHPSWTRAVASPAPYRELERRLAALVGAYDTVVFPTVTLLHFGVLPALAGANGAILIDSAAHHSMQEAAQLARGKGIKVTGFKHCDIPTLEKKLASLSSASNRVIVLDGVYSMSGSSADLELYRDLARRYDAVLYVDDAHGFGILGENPTSHMPYGFGGGGVVRHLGLDYDRIVYVAGMSKAFSSMAAFIACNSPQDRTRYERASTMIFGGPIPVASLASAIAGLDVNGREGDMMRARLWSLTKRLLDGIDELGFEVASTAFPIINVILGEADVVLGACRILWEEGVLLTPSVFPAMPIDRGGVRFTLTAANTEDQVDGVIRGLARVKAKYDVPMFQRELARAAS